MEYIASSVVMTETYISKVEMSDTLEPSLEAAKNYIKNINFSNILNKMVCHQGWKHHQAEAVCEQYRNFLWLHKKYGKQYTLPPSEEIDEFWHNHILDTQQYRKDCQAIFGVYLDHYPYLGIDGKTDRNDLNNYFLITRELYEKEIGKPLVNILVPGLRGLMIRFLERLDQWVTPVSSKERS